MTHIPRYQSALGERFVVCSCQAFRSGVGDLAYIREQFEGHLRLMGEA